MFDTVVRPVEGAPWGITAFVDAIEWHVGGNGANTALGLANLGVPARLLAAVGDDEQGRFALERLRRAGADISRVTTVDAPTAATVVLVKRDGERGFLHRLGASALAFAEPIEFTPAVTDGMSHYHLASIFGMPRQRRDAAMTLERAHSAGLTTSLDTNWDTEGLWMRDLGPCLPNVDVLFINQDEARMSTGSDVPEVAGARLLERGAGAVVLKLGARGCAIYAQDAGALCPAYEVEARDTTGAGDCFVAGFLAARARGADLKEAGQFANAVAALTVQKLGGAEGVPSYDEVRRWMG